MGVGIFGGCSKLEGKEGFTVIDGILFGYTGQHEILEIPEGVRVIAAGTFKGARYSGNVYKAKEIVLSNTLEVIGENAFEGVSNLKEIVIPVNVKVIKKEAFMSSGLEKVTFLDGVSEIGEGAFKYTKLTEIRIPKSVKTLRKEAFYRCESLRDLYISEETTEIEDNLLGTDGNTPTSSWSAYKPNGVYVHTPENSVAAEYMKRYSGVHVANDYSEE